MFDKLFYEIDEMIAEELGVPTEVYVKTIEEYIDVHGYQSAQDILTPLMTESTDEEREESIKKFKEFQEKT